ncbi:MAG: ATP-dependent DNA helicase [Acidobacteriota bacterium]
MTEYLEQVFGDGGLLARRFPGYEKRVGQVALACVVDQAMRDERHALGEGPCGTGKGVAYGVPSVWHARHRDKKVVIATANIALQEQLVRKDLPLLSEVLPWPFTFALLKGRNNFLCHDRMAESEARGELAGFTGDDLDRQLAEVAAWAETTTTGDVSELPFVPPPQVWSRFSVGSDDCKGDGCRFRDACFAERAKAAAAEADIVVTNYHLLFAHLAVRRETGQDLVLPAFDYLVLDEAHEAADIARDFFGFTVSEFVAIRLARFAEKLGKKKLAERLRREASDFFAAVADHARSPAYKCRLKRPGFASAAQLLKPLDELAAVAGRIEEDESLDKEDRAKGRIARRQASTAAARLREATALSDPAKVYFIDLDQKGRAKLGAKPVHVADLLREELFGGTASVTMVSATMTTAGTFDFIRAEAGVPDDALEVVADSPFDFEHQALLVVPEGLPDPREPEFVEAAADAFKKVIDLCDGRTLGLFTSYRNLNAVHERVRRNGHRVLRQGELPRTELTRVFKEDVGSVLLGTESFWTGIDVPGEALTGLVIDKLPFPNMDDPVVDAICAADRNAFNSYLVPRAIIMLRQGVGRLIRSQSDVGVAVILDRRIADKPYGRRFIRSLPPMLTTRNLDNISRFLAEASDAGPG